MNIFTKLFSRPSGPSEDLRDGPFIDLRDGHQYATARIGEHVWLAENLAYIPRVSHCSTQGGIWVYDYIGDDPEAAKSTINYERYGCLYDFETAKQMCPKGWRLPTKADFQDLLKAANSPLGECFTYYNLTRGGESGFNAVHGGYRLADKESAPKFTGLGEYGDWWTTDEGGYKPDSSDKFNATLHVQTEVRGGRFFVDGGPGAGLNYGLSVRCVKR